MTFFRKKKKSDQSTEVSKKDFAEFWGGIMPTIRTVKNAGHCFSAVTEYLVLQKIVGAEFSGLYKFWAILLSILITISIIAIIEMGISRFAPFVFRFLFRKKFNTGWNWLMFIPILAVVIPLTFFSTTLSRDGGFEIVDSARSEVAMTDLNKADDDYERQKDKAQASFDDKKSSINQSFDNKVAANKSDFAAQIGIQQQEIKKNKRLVLNGHEWAQGHIDKAYADIAKLKAKRDTKESQIETERTNALLAAASTFDANVLKIENRADKHLSQVEKRDSKKEAKRNKFVSTWGGLLGSVALFSVLGVLFCIALIEIYRAGSGQEYEKAIDNGKKSRFEKLGLAITQKIGSGADWVIRGIEKDWTKGKKDAPTLSEQDNSIYLTKNEGLQVAPSTSLATNETPIANKQPTNYNQNSIGFKYYANSEPSIIKNQQNETAKDADYQAIKKENIRVGEELKKVKEWVNQAADNLQTQKTELNKMIRQAGKRIDTFSDQLTSAGNETIALKNQYNRDKQSWIEEMRQLSQKNETLAKRVLLLEQKNTPVSVERITTNNIETVTQFDATYEKQKVKKYIDRFFKSYTTERETYIKEGISRLVHNGYEVKVNWAKETKSITTKPIFKVGEKKAVITITHNNDTVQNMTVTIINA